jgi:hypothetical protein
MGVNEGKMSLESLSNNSQRTAPMDEPMSEAFTSPSRNKIMQLTGVDLSIQQPTALPSQKLLQSTEYGSGYIFLRNREYLRSSTSSENSESVYSREEAEPTTTQQNNGEDRIMSPVSPASNKSDCFQLTAVQNEKSSDLPQGACTTGAQWFPYHDRPSTYLGATIEKPRERERAMTLEDLVLDERNRFERDGFTDGIWQTHTANIPNQSDGGRPTSEVPCNSNLRMVDFYKSISHPLSLRPKPPIPERCQSRFSDHSSDSGISPLTQARGSVISHLRSISSGTNFKLPDRLYTNSHPKAVNVSHIEAATSPDSHANSPTNIDPVSPNVFQRGKRKRNLFSAGGRPPKSPFTFTAGPSNSRFNSISDACPSELSRQNRSKLSRRFSDAFKTFSSSNFKPTILEPSPSTEIADQSAPTQERILHTHARRHDGPDTPFFFSRFVLHRRATPPSPSVSPRWAARRNIYGSSPTKRVKSSSSQIWGAAKEVGGVVRDAGDKAREVVVVGAAKVGGSVKAVSVSIIRGNMEEKRRDALRKTIRVVGVSEEEEVDVARNSNDGIDSMERMETSHVQQTWM